MADFRTLSIRAIRSSRSVIASFQLTDFNYAILNQSPPSERANPNLNLTPNPMRSPEAKFSAQIKAKQPGNWFTVCTKQSTVVGSTALNQQAIFERLTNARVTSKGSRLWGQPEKSDRFCWTWKFWVETCKTQISKRRVHKLRRFGLAGVKLQFL